MTISSIVKYLLSVDLLSRKGWQRVYWEKISRYLARMGGPRLASKIMLQGVDLSHVQRNDEPTILCIERRYFSKDIAQLRLRTEFNWISLNLGLLVGIQGAWLPLRTRQQLYFVRHKDRKFLRARALADSCCFMFLQRLTKMQRIDAIMSANIDYWQDKSIRRACKKLNIPFLVLCKEHRIVPNKYSNSMDRFKEVDFIFTGDGVAVFGQTTAELLVNSGACRKEQVWATGPPRLDAWQEVELDSIKRKNIVLLSYASSNYGVQNNFFEVLLLLAFLSLKNRNPDVKFIVKCKSMSDRLVIEKHLSKQKHSLYLYVDEPLYELLPTARLVVGFNSLSVLEALLTKATLVIPSFGETACEPDKLMVSPSDTVSRKVFKFAGSSEELSKFIEMASSGNYKTNVDMQIRRDLFYRYFHKPKATSYCDEVANFVRHFIGNDQGEKIRENSTLSEHKSFTGMN